MGLKRRLGGVAGGVSFLAQWLCYRLVAAVEPLRARFPSPSFARNEDLWVFGARGGEAFVDNAKYLYLHATAERPETRAVWLSKDSDTVAELQSAGYEAYHAHSLRGVLLTLRAGAVFLTQGHRDLFMPATGGAFAVLLWHGVPLKHVSWDAGFRDLPAPLKAAHADMAEEFDLLTIPGRNLEAAFASGLRIDPDRMAVVGYPRNDALSASIPGEEVGTDAEALARIRQLADDTDECDLVFYLPTFREWTDESVTDHLDLPALDAFLGERDALLVLKTHPKERLDLPEGLDSVVQLSEATDPYPFLRYADVLVTDYSSVYFDFLVTDRPVVFYPYDLAEYQNRRGFYFDYEAVTPGPVARDFEEFLAGLDRALAPPDAGAQHGHPDAEVQRRHTDVDAERRHADAEAERGYPDVDAQRKHADADAERRREVRKRLLDGDPTAGSGENTSRAHADDCALEAPRSGAVYERSAAVYELVRERLADRNQKVVRERRNR